MGGKESIPGDAAATISSIRADGVRAFGVIADADDDYEATFIALRDALVATGSLDGAWAGLANSGAIHIDGSVALGIYTWPDSASNGALEAVLIECAAVVGAKELADASDFVEVQSAGRTGAWTEWCRQKAVLSSAGSVMVNTPRFANASNSVKLQHTGWMQAHALTVPKVQAVLRFIANVADITLP